MILTDTECMERIKRPVNEAFLKAGRELERQHRRHIEGDAEEIRHFLRQNDKLETASTSEIRLRYTKAITSAAFAPVLNEFYRSITADAKYTYNFQERSTLDLEQDFKDYLADTKRNGQTVYQYLHEKIHKKHWIGFLGLIMVDLPATENINGLPEPYAVYIASDFLHDIQYTGFKVEYLIQCREEKMVVNNLYGIPAEEKIKVYTVTDDLTHRAFYYDKQSNLVQLTDRLIAHNLGYVPAFPLSLTRTEVKKDLETVTSLVYTALPYADLMLSDHSDHELNKKFHAYQEKWSYGMKCPRCDGKRKETIVIEGESRSIDCGRCDGTGTVIPVGPDKTYLKATPRTSADLDLKGDPAGYISKDLAPTEYLYKQMLEEEEAIYFAVFGKDLQGNIHSETATAKEINEESKRNKLKEYSKLIEFIVQRVVDTMGKIRYDESYISSTVHYSTNFTFKTTHELELEFKEKKQAGLDATVLFENLKDIIKSKYKGDPIQLERELIKLHLTPFPTYTLAEIQNLPFIPEEAKRMKAYINDFIERFELENGSLARFGVLLDFNIRIQRIKEILQGYNNEFSNLIIDNQDGNSENNASRFAQR